MNEELLGKYTMPGIGFGTLGNVGDAGRDAAIRQMENSLRVFGRDTIDLIQVHNLGDVPVQLGILKELKQQGRVRYIGVTTTSNRQYEDLMAIMRNEPIDFIGLDYAIDNREPERMILPLAQDEGIAVLVYLPFGRSRMSTRNT